VEVTNDADGTDGTDDAGCIDIPVDTAVDAEKGFVIGLTSRID
jgi:hypothetical protein